ADEYFRASGDGEGRALLPLYTAYRAAVRASVDGMKSAEPEVPEAARTAARLGSPAHWLLALGALDEPRGQPCLVLLGGLQGTGKSTLARNLGEQADSQVIRSDVVRKELAAGTAEDVYTPEWNDRTYASCLERAGRVLFEGGRVLIDATFRQEKYRRLFLDE